MINVYLKNGSGPTNTGLFGTTFKRSIKLYGLWTHLI